MIKGLLRTAVIAVLVMILTLCAGITEEALPLSPEPSPAVSGALTATPAPEGADPAPAETQGPAGTPVPELPPSPEPPAGNIQVRPTPAPTEVPEATLIDHVHWPNEYKDFAFMEGKKLFEVWFPNIRDADEAVLVYDGHAWMIDCGDSKSGARGARMLEQLGIMDIEVLLNSHMHHDHIDGLEATAEVAKIGEIRICFAPDLTESGLRMLQTAETWEIPVKEYKDGDVFRMGDGAVEILVLQNSEAELDINNRSAVMKVTYGNRSILFTADMEWPGQDAMVRRLGENAGILKSDILKYPHHAKSDLNTPFFEAVNADLAVVTSLEGRKDAGQYGLQRRCLPAVFTASKEYYIHLVTDGDYWLVEKVKIRQE